MNIKMNERPVLRDLDEGLVLCRSQRADADALAEFNSRIHSEDGFDQPDARLGAWTHDLLARPHPTFHEDDCTLVVESASGRIVSSMNLISQTWSYAGIPIPVGRPELVGTLSEFRNRGLVRIQFDEVHRWSAARRELMLGITGIPFYYKLFGYEMGMELGGGRIGYETQLPKLKEGEAEAFVFRPARDKDIPFLMEVHARASQRHLVSCLYDEAQWRYLLNGQSETNVTRLEYRIIERAGSHESLGYLSHPWYSWEAGLGAFQYELKAGVSWLDVTPAVARYLWNTGGEYALRDAKPEQRTIYAFWFGSEHPGYDLFRDRLPRRRDPYAWFVRIPDLPDFLRHIRPVLEARLAASVLVGYSGEIKVSFYRSGIRLAFEHGRLSVIEPWMPTPEERGEAAFPDLSFLQMVFGYRSFEELEQSYADCWYTGDDPRVLLNTLFPRQASQVLAVN
jgi:hypothetical protein